MRLWLWLSLFALLVVAPGSARAKPILAVAPLDGDSENKVAAAIAKAAAEDAKVIALKDTRRAIGKLGLFGDFNQKDLKKLRDLLGVDLVVQGTVGKEGKLKTVELRISGRGMRPSRFTIKFRSEQSPKFAEDVHAELAKRLGGTTGGEDESDESEKPKKITDEDPPRRTKRSEEDDLAPKRTKRSEEDDLAPKRTKRSEEDDLAPKRTKRSEADEAAPRRSRRVAEEANKEGSVRKKKRRKRDDEDEQEVEARRHPVTQVAVRVNAGAAFNRRSLTYDAIGTMAPRPVGIVAASGRIEAEVYPFATSTLEGPIAGLGLYGDFDKTFGESVVVPGTTTTVSIDQTHYVIGARYRVSFDTTVLAVGIGYARRTFIADRSPLATPTALDTPDVDYTAIAPGAMVRIAAGPKIGVFFGGDLLLLTGAGPIVQADSYGFADTTAFDATGGVDLSLAPSYALRFAAELAQVGLEFRGNAQTMARGITAATDRTIAITATFAVTY